MDNLTTRLERLDSCAISDALDTLGLKGVATGIQRLATDRRISGRVVTVKLEVDDGRPAASRHLGTTAVEGSHPGDVIVIEQRTGIDAASWGGNLSLAARMRDIAGVIVMGLRDGLIAWARLYVEDVEQGDGIDAAVRTMTGS